MIPLLMRKKRLSVHTLLRRAINQSTPGKAPLKGEKRWETRSNRTLVVLVVPVVRREIQVEQATAALTKNISSDGVALVTTAPPGTDRLLIGFLLDGRAVLVRGQVQMLKHLGGGFCQACVELSEILNCDAIAEYDAICERVKQLRP